MADWTTTMTVVAALAAPGELPPAQQTVSNWCTVGYVVMLPEGREGVVSSVDGEICRVFADGEKYVTLIPHFIVEPVYPQQFAARPYR